MKKFMKKNNKGFSLVELIVVVLIIAIIAVALAPQVSKWVKKATDNTKKNNGAAIKGAIQTCVTEFFGESKTIDKTITVTVNGAQADFVTVEGSDVTATNTDLDTLITAAVEGLKDANTYTYTISTAGIVTDTTTYQ